MSAPINLNRARKQRAKEVARKTADENAVKHGRSKARRVSDAAETKRARQRLDAHRMRDPEA